jgi:hypothetical protein
VPRIGEIIATTKSDKLRPKLQYAVAVDFDGNVLPATWL